MLLSTMTYEQIYREIKNDAPELFVAIEKKLPEFRKYAKRASGAYGRNGSGQWYCPEMDEAGKGRTGEGRNGRTKRERAMILPRNGRSQKRTNRGREETGGRNGRTK